VDTITLMARDYVDERSKNLMDNCFQATQLGRTMRESARRWAGSPAVTEAFVYAGSGGGGIRKGRRFTNSQRQLEQQLRWTPRQLRIPIVLDLADLRVYNAPNSYRIMDLLESRISNAFLTLGSHWEISMFLPGSGASWGDVNVNGWAEICNDGTNVSWDNVVYNEYGELLRNDANYGRAIRGNVLSLGTEINYDALEKTYTRATIGGAEPTIGYTTPLVRSAINMQFQAQQRFTEVTEPTLGFTGVKFKHALILDSRYCPGSEAAADDIADEYAVYTTEESATPLSGYPTPLNSHETFWWFNTGDAYVHYYVSTDRIFGGGIQDFIPSAESDALVSAVRLAYIFASPGPRYHYQINDIIVN
jgi:hypothetical protein